MEDSDSINKFPLIKSLLTERQLFNNYYQGIIGVESISNHIDDKSYWYFKSYTTYKEHCCLNVPPCSREENKTAYDHWIFRVACVYSWLATIPPLGNDDFVGLAEKVYGFEKLIRSNLNNKSVCEKRCWVGKNKDTVKNYFDSIANLLYRKNNDSPEDYTAAVTKWMHFAFPETFPILDKNIGLLLDVLPLFKNFYALTIYLLDANTNVNTEEIKELPHSLDVVMFGIIKEIQKEIKKKLEANIDSHMVNFQKSALRKYFNQIVSMKNKGVPDVFTKWKTDNKEMLSDEKKPKKEKCDNFINHYLNQNQQDWADTEWIVNEVKKEKTLFLIEEPAKIAKTIKDLLVELYVPDNKIRCSTKIDGLNEDELKFNIPVKYKHTIK